MAESTKQRLSAMLDVDLEHADATIGAKVHGAGDDGPDQRPNTFSEWFQVATPQELRVCLKSLVAEHGDVAIQVRDLLEEEKAHRDWVTREEKQWKEGNNKVPEKTAAAKAVQQNANELEEPSDMVRVIPLRLTPEERDLLVILQGALYVSEYTDRVDVYHTGNKAHRMALQIQQVCAILAGLVVANNFDVARRPLMEHDFAENKHFFRAIFEIGRRYKILNPDKLRGSYGKLIHMLQDSVKEEVVRAVGFECVAPVKTVATMLRTKKCGEELLNDPLLLTATREVYETGRSREEVRKEVEEKNEALAELKKKYAEAPEPGKPPPKSAGDLGDLLRGKQTETAAMTAANVETIVASIGDHFAFQRFNREPCDRMISFLKTYFNPNSEREWSLEICRGRAGSCLSHNHRTQFTFVLQSLLLWREIMGNMFALWQGTEEDLLDTSLRYRLCDTGQGLNRMQSAPRVSRMMKQILHQVQSEVGGWVGLSVVHLGDRDVPNALVFIDKYTQVPRILAPIVATLDKLQEVYASSPANKRLIDKEFGGVDQLRMVILQDFFRHGFDGSGDDGGSCVDGRLTSCWNWCSKIEKKKYFQAFLLTGFTGFDGGFESSAGW
jgi:hypothetical protein